MARPDELVFVPLGGVGEIGMNLSLYGFGTRHQRNWLVVDVGVTFGDEEHLPGVDLILPDIRFLVEGTQNLVGIVITHAHEDHYGALLDLWPRLQVPGLYDAVHRRRCSRPRRRRAERAEDPGHMCRGRPLHLGPFDIESIPVAHSIPEPNALAIRTPLGTVIHTGDWKLDPTPIIGLPTDETAAARTRRRGRAGAGLRFHQRGARRPFALGEPRSRKPSPS